MFTMAALDVLVTMYCKVVVLTHSLTATRNRSCTESQKICISR